MSDNTKAQVRHIYEAWHAGTNSHDVPRVIALYAEKAVLGSPAILAICPHLQDGILRGRSKIEKFFTNTISALSKKFRELYRSDLFLSTGKLLTWEYPRYPIIAASLGRGSTPKFLGALAREEAPGFVALGHIPDTELRQNWLSRSAQAACFRGSLHRQSARHGDH